MTEFELIFLFNECFNTMYVRLNNFMAGFFAMLVASYFVGAKLSRTMACLVAGLYTLFSMATIVPTIAASVRMVLAAQQVKLVAGQTGSDLAPLISIMPSWGMVMPTMIILLIASYCGAMVFFFQARKGINTVTEIQS